MMRRSTSLAVCCAPIRMMPSERPALGHVEQDLLDRRLAVAGRVLVELVEHDEQQRPRLAAAFLVVERTPQRDADDEALGAVVEVVEVDDGDLGGGVDPVPQTNASAATSARTRRASDRCDDNKRRTNALIVPMPVDRSGPGPAHHRIVVGDVRDRRSRRARDTCAALLPSIRHAPSPAGWPSRFERGGDVVHDHRVLLAFVFGVGEHEREQLFGRELLDRPEERVHAELAGLRRRESRCGSSRRGGAYTATSANAPGIIPRSRYFCDCSGESLTFSWSRKSRSSPLTLKISAFVLRRVGAEHAGVEQAVQQEGRVAWSWSRRRRCPRC